MVTFEWLSYSYTTLDTRYDLIGFECHLLMLVPVKQSFQIQHMQSHTAISAVVVENVVPSSSKILLGVSIKIMITVVHLLDVS